MKRIDYTFENVRTELENSNEVFVHLENGKIVVDVLTDKISNEEAQQLLKDTFVLPSTITLSGTVTAILEDDVKDLKDKYTNDIATDIAYKISKCEGFIKRPLFGPVIFSFDRDN